MSIKKSSEHEFIEKIINLIDKWVNDQCAFCDPGTMVSIEGMAEFRCINCNKSMNDSVYLGEIVRLVSQYRNKFTEMG